MRQGSYGAEKLLNRVVFHGESACDVHSCTAPLNFYENSEKLFFPDQQKSGFFCLEVEKSNDGDRLKRVLPKFEVCTASV